MHPHRRTFLRSQNRDSKERNFRFACNRFRQQRFTVPGGPTIRTPFGILPPSFWSGSARADTQPVQQLLLLLRRARNVSKGRFDLIFRQHARFALPNDMAPLPPPPCI